MSTLEPAILWTDGMLESPLPTMKIEVAVDADGLTIKIHALLVGNSITPKFEYSTEDEIRAVVPF